MPTASRLAVLGHVQLSGPGGAPVPASGFQPKRLVLLVYLALTPHRAFVRRDTLLALFWPDLPSDQARHALRQSLHQLRTTFGRDAIVGRGEGELAASPEHLLCDVNEFEEHLRAGNPTAAMLLHRGELLAGVFVADAAPELEQWLDAERVRIRRLAMRGAWTAAREAEHGGRPQDAADWARQAVRLAPDDEDSVRSLMALLDRTGDRAGALRVYDEFARHLATEYGVEPSRATRDLLASFTKARSKARPLAVPDGVAPAEPEADSGQLPPISGMQASPRARHRRAALALAGILAAAAAMILGLRHPGSRPVPEILAVGGIEADGHRAPDSLDLPGTVRSMLATDLARLQCVQVLSQSRVYEVMGRSGESADSSSGLAAAARRAGATEIIQGKMEQQASGLLRLRIERVDAQSGAVRDVIAAEAYDPFSLVAQVTGQIAAAHHIPPPRQPLASATSRSIVAQGFYASGLREFYQRNDRAARRDFLAALEEDSAFVAPAYYLLATQLAGSELGRMYSLLDRAARSAQSAPERDRLQIRILWATVTQDMSLPALAESLATRYPAEPEGAYALGQALLQSGDFLGAIPWLRRAIRIDSAGRTGPWTGDTRCTPCNGLGGIVIAYAMADSGNSAVRAAREWRASSRGVEPDAAMVLAQQLELLGRRAEALAIVHDSLAAGILAGTRFELEVQAAIRAGDWAEARRLTETGRASGGSVGRLSTRWWAVIVARNRGRPLEALHAADEYCGMLAREYAHSDFCALIRSTALLDLGRARDAAAGVASSLRTRNPDSLDAPGQAARRTAWLLVHLGVARAASGDTVALAALAREAEQAGRMSGYGRDHVVYHHLYGLLYAARGKHQQAAEEFSRAIWSPNFGYTRTNYELARALLELGQPDEAARAIEPVLRGLMSGMGLYLTQTEAHALLAEAQARAGRREEALQHLRWVESAWKEAEPPVQARLASLRREVTSASRPLQSRSLPTAR